MCWTWHCRNVRAKWCLVKSVGRLPVQPKMAKQLQARSAILPNCHLLTGTAKTATAMEIKTARAKGTIKTASKKDLEKVQTPNASLLVPAINPSDMKMVFLSVRR